VRHVTFRRNVVRNASGGVAMSGTVNGGKYWPGEFLNTVLFEDNVFSDIGTESRRHVGTLFQFGGPIWNISIVHNTGSATRHVIMPEGEPKKNVYVANNVFGPSQYGIKGPNAGGGAATLKKYFPDGTFVANAMVDGKAKTYPGRNFFPGSLSAAAGFRGTDGRPVGADRGAVEAATRGVAGSWTRDGAAGNAAHR
jgi:hypothetical protein